MRTGDENSESRVSWKAEKGRAVLWWRQSVLLSGRWQEQSGANMRIISGTHRSRQILAPKGIAVTRPITDRVKQSLFDRLWAMGKVGFVEEEGDDGIAVESAEEGENAGGGNVIDLFSGTGSLGLEALSRGSARCLFIEKDRSAKALLEENVRTFDLESRAMILGMDAVSGTWLGAVPREYRPARMVFCDPPYQMMEEEATSRRLVKVLGLLAETAGLVEPDGVLVIRTNDRVGPVAIAGWSEPESYTYGSMVLHFYVHVPGRDSQGSQVQTPNQG